MTGSKLCLVTLCLIVSLLIGPHEAFEDHVEEEQTKVFTSHQTPSPKDKVLLKDVKTLLFYRNKRTTSRRTHTIPQLSCVGGTAGCKLFTPDTVECANIGFNRDKGSFNWKCKAETSDRVRFNHVEVICEGYEYPEDDYILLGSCGLEFTLDYTDPHDAHQNSYFHHTDDHEKAMHHERVRATAKPRSAATSHIGYQFLDLLISGIMDHKSFILLFVSIVMCSFLLVRYLSPTKTNEKGKAAQRGSPTYKPLASVVLTTKTKGQ